MVLSRLPSSLLDKSDKELRRFDRRLRRVLLRYPPSVWPPAEEIPKIQIPGTEALTLIYHSGALANQGKRAECSAELREVLIKEGIPSIKALALQTLVTNLYAYSIEERASGNLESSSSAEKECRELCELGLREYESFDWFESISYAIHAALGILDYYKGESWSAKVHLRKAIEDQRHASSDFDKVDSVTIGLVHMYLGDTHKLEKNPTEAKKEYDKAIRKLEGSRRVLALARLGSLILDEKGNPREARRVLKRALRTAKGVSVEPDVIDELKCNLAWVMAHMGHYDEAEKIYQDVVMSTKNQKTRQTVMGYLDKRIGSTGRKE